MNRTIEALTALALIAGVFGGGAGAVAASSQEHATTSDVAGVWWKSPSGWMRIF